MRKSWMVLLASVVVLAAAGGKKGDKGTPMPPPPTSNFYVASGFAKDAAPYVGRFMPTDGEVDEARSMQTTCSKYIGYTYVEAGGVTYDELFNANSGITARLQVPVFADLAVGATGGVMVRAKYELIGKMVAEVKDPMGLASCCMKNANQCTDRFVGEFFQGKGTLYYATARAIEGAGSGRTTQGVSMGLEVSRGFEWNRSIEFTQPVYFAYRLSDVPKPPGPEVWKNQPPQSDYGQFFVGLSNPYETEAAARDAAMLNARVQAVKFIGESIKTGSVGVTLTEGQLSALSSRMKDAATLETSSQALAQYVKDWSWDVARVDTPDGPQFTAYVLAFLPKEEAAAAATALAGTP